MKEKLKFLLIPRVAEIPYATFNTILGAAVGGFEEAAVFLAATYGAGILNKYLSTSKLNKKEFSRTVRELDSSENILSHSIDKILTKDTKDFYSKLFS